MKIMSKVHVLTIFLTCFSLGISYGWRGTHWLRHSSSTSCSHHLSMSSLTPPTSANNKILRKVDKWACISNCGACCKLGMSDYFDLIRLVTNFISWLHVGPIESRPDLDTYLTPPELEKYKSMIGSDDWCIHFDKKKRMCTIYEDRPGFCRVDAQSYKKMYDIEGKYSLIKILINIIEYVALRIWILYLIDILNLLC